MGKKDNWFFEACICLRCGRRAESFERRPAAGASRRLVATVLSANHPPAQPRAQTGPRIRRLKRKAINFPYGMMEFLLFKISRNLRPAGFKSMKMNWKASRIPVCRHRASPVVTCCEAAVLSPWNEAFRDVKIAR